MKHIVTLSILSLCLFGFTGQERFVELEGFLNARSSVAFRAQDRNIITVLNRGTRGEIKEAKRLNSGNYALRIETLNGQHNGKSFWVYYKVSEPALKLYEKAPPSWEMGDKPRRVAETTRDVGAYKDPEAKEKQIAQAPVPPARPGNLVAPAPIKAAGGVDSGTASKLLSRAATLNGAVRAAGTQNNDNCASCAAVATQRAAPAPKVRTERADAKIETVRSLIHPASRRTMHDSCYSIVRPDGSYGGYGQQIASIMKESRYYGLYTKPGALGNFCPKFNSLSNDQKIQAWAWFWTSLANREASCQVNKHHPTHYSDERTGQWVRLNNHEGWGMFAAEKDSGIRARNRRGPECSDITSFAGQARCAISTMAKHQLAGSSASGGSKYWGPIQGGRANREIMPNMRRFSACF